MTQSVKQYIDLWHHDGAVIDSHAPQVMNRHRQGAAAVLERAGLPRRGDEGYTEVDLQRMFAPDMGINIERIPFRADVAAAFRCQVPNISTLLGITANDIYAPSDSLLRLLPEGVTVCTFSQAAKTMPGILDRYYNALAAEGDDGAAALNTLLAQDGILVHVAAGVHCDKPIQLVNILGGVNAPMLALRRMLVVVEQGAKCRILSCDHAEGDLHNTVNAVTEIYLGRDARLEFYDLEESSPATRRCATVRVSQAAHSSLALNVTTLRCGVTRNNITVDLNGEHAETSLSGIAIADGTQIADNATAVNHHAGDCHSNQTFKYVVDGQGHGSFEGLIRVDEGAVRTDAYQSNRNILAGKDARMHTQPQLEIYCDDVKCSHGSATGQIDERQLFYMQSRGIPRAEARTMLMQAFMADVIDAISLEPLRDRLRHLVDQRLTGQTLSCGDCAKPSIS